ncbi:MAG: hydrogenase expression/formation protein HypE, partial [Shewanella sp.]|nr:hydrogenase expression/formation protein HypE [Shewanella sp.]
VLQNLPSCPGAALIGRVSNANPGKVILTSPWGSSRYLELPVGELLPRIC